VHPEHRSIVMVQKLNQMMLATLKERGFDMVFSMPNAEATKIDQFYLKVQPVLALDISAFPALGFGSGGRLMPAEPGNFQPYLGGADSDGMVWTGETLADRLERPDRRYVVFGNGRAMVIASPVTLKGLPVALICGVFIAPGQACTTLQLHALCAGAARACGRAIFLYVGANAAMKKAPGLAFPARLRPSPMLLHAAALTERAAGFQPQRFEAIDFDFA
jgi:hypothetical protein